MPECAERVDALRRRVQSDAIYISEGANIRYLTGFSGEAGHLLVTPDRVTLFTDGRFGVQAEQQVDANVKVDVARGDPRPRMVAEARYRRLKRLRFEADRLRFSGYRFLSTELRKCRLVPTGGAVEGLRMIKSQAEIAAIRKAAELNSAAFEHVCAAIRPGWTEARLAAEIEYCFRSRGGDGPSFPTIVASGAHAALPHAMPRPVPIEPNSLVVVDQGVTLNGYCSDMTRMISIGQPPDKELRLLEAVLEAQQAALDAVRHGAECKAVDERARDVLNQHSAAGVRLAKRFIHSLGHGVGLEIHERPGIAPNEKLRLKQGMVVTVEPGVYFKGWAGVRVEDLVVVTSDGCEVLSRTEKGLRMIGGTGK